MKVQNLILIAGFLSAAAFAHASETAPYELLCKVTQETNINGDFVHEVIQTERTALVVVPVSGNNKVMTYKAHLQFSVQPKVGNSFSIDAKGTLIPDYSPPRHPEIKVAGKVYNQVRARVSGVTFEVPVKSQLLADFKIEGESLVNGPWFKVDEVAFFVDCTLKRSNL